MLDPNKYRHDFPMLSPERKMQGKPLVWLDNASTTFKPLQVLKAIEAYYVESTSNSHRGDYDLCHDMDVKIADVRKKVATFINADADEVVFTSGTTASINLVAFGYALHHLSKGDEIILTVAEHASNVLPWREIAALTGAVIKFAELEEDGSLTPRSLEKAISDKTKIVAIAHVTNVLGTVAPIKDLARIAHSHGAIIAVDGAQSVPHMLTDVKDLDCDFLSFSGHKMIGPTGIGVLYGKREILSETSPYMTGGGMNVSFNVDGTHSYLKPPMRFEAGTQNIEGILGLGAAIDYLMSIGMENIHEYETTLKRYAVERLLATGKCEIINPDSETGIVAFNMKGVFAQDGATFLNSRGIACRSGNHCAKMLPDFLKTIATIRASFYFYTTKEEIDALVEAVNHKEDYLDAYFI